MLQQRLLVNNPREVAYDDALAIYRAAYAPESPRQERRPMSRPQAPARGAYRWFTPITTRWSDNDLYGHVNNVVYYSYFDSIANRYLIEVGGLDITGIQTVGLVVNSSCDYHAPVAYPQALEAPCASIAWATARCSTGSPSSPTGDRGLLPTAPSPTCLSTAPATARSRFPPQLRAPWRRSAAPARPAVVWSGCQQEIGARENGGARTAPARGVRRDRAGRRSPGR
jgi:hypothetical protein